MKIVLFFALIFAALAEPKKKGIRTQVKEKLKENGFKMIIGFLSKLESSMKGRLLHLT